MPHLELGTFAGQAFWLLISFSVLYYLVANFLLPNVAKVVDARAEKISDDIEQAEILQNKSVRANEKHQSVLAKATAEARKTLDEAMKKVEENIEVKRKELQTNIDKSLVAAENKIAAIELESFNIVGKISADIAKIMAEKAAA